MTFVATAIVAAAAFSGNAMAQDVPTSFCVDGTTLSIPIDDLFGVPGADVGASNVSWVASLVAAGPIFYVDPAGSGENLGIYHQNDEGIPDAALENVHTVTLGACASVSSGGAPVLPPPPRGGYCSVAGNTLNGNPLAPGTFLNLVFGQPGSDSDYKGAVPAAFIQGVGLTCDAPPVGFAFDGAAFANGDGVPGVPGDRGAIYPFYKAP